MKEKNRKDYKIFIFLAILLLIFLILNFVSPLLIWDETVYLSNARGHIAQSNYIEDFRFPLTEYLVSTVWRLTGESVFAARFLVIILTVLSSFLVYLIGKRYFSEKNSLILTMIFSLSPLILFWGFRVYADIPAMFFTILSFYFLLKNEETKKRYIFVALAGISLALAFLTRFPLALFIPCVILYQLTRKRIKEPLIMIFFFLLTLCPWLIYNQITYHNPIWDLLKQFSVVQQWTTWEPISKQIMNLIYSIGIFIIPLVLGFFSLIKNKKPLKITILSYVLLSLVYYLFFVKLKDMRYYLAFLPFLCILIFEGILFIKSKIKNKKIKTIILIILILNSIILTVGTIYIIEKHGNCTRNSAMIESLSYLQSKVEKNEIITSNCWTWFGYYLNVKVFSPWTDPQSLIKNYNVTRIVICSEFGEPYTQEELKFLTLEKEITGKCNQKIRIYKS